MKKQFLIKSVIIGVLFLTFFKIQVMALPIPKDPKSAILADKNLLQALHIPILSSADDLNLAYAEVGEAQLRLIEYKAHNYRKCGGYENLGPIENSFSRAKKVQNLFRSISLQNEKNILYSSAPYRPLLLKQSPQIQEALPLLQEQNLLSATQWLSSFPDRYNRASDPNRHVIELQKKLEQMLSSSRLKHEITLINHRSTKQKSLRVRIPGALRPQEIIVLGGHLDSINQWGMGKAPGADDNASGSSNLIETLRVLSQFPQPERTVEFFWYAGEESGLLGSAEIAAQYKQENQQALAVLQLDMTLYPGAGEFVIGNVEDYTSSWLRSYLVEINSLYSLGVRFVSDKCGYACSDHASWYRHGFPTLMPFESDTQRMNSLIHTAQDSISPRLNFRHSLVFAKIALVFAMDLANSNARQPY